VSLQGKDPVDYVQRLLEERDKYENVIVRAFADDKNFRNELNKVSSRDCRVSCTWNLGSG
jgi:hypothetical protein